MATGEKRAVLMQSDKGVPGGVAALDANGKVVGAVSKDGDIMTGAIGVAISGGNAVLFTDSACAYLQSYKDQDWERRRTLIVRNVDTSPDLVSAVTIAVQDDGTWKEYAVLHQKNLHLISPAAIGAASAEEVRQLTEQVAALAAIVNKT